MAYKNPGAVLTGVLIALMLGGCASLQENIGKAVGTTVGAGLGLVGCQELGGSDAECAAAAIAGGVVGYSLGSLYDERRRRLEAVARETDADIEFETVKVATHSTVSNGSTSGGKTDSSEGLVASVRSSEMFVVGRSRPTESARNTFAQLAEVYAEQFSLEDGTRVETQLLIVGHADATGGASRNQVLSERRATAIATLFNEAGLPAERLYVSGAGSSQPVADNNTSAGREQNRRVEILEISDEQGLVSYADLRRRDPKFLEHSTRSPEQTVAGTAAGGEDPSAGDVSATSAALVDFAGTPADETDTSVLMAIAGDTGQSGLLSQLLPADSGYRAGDKAQPSVPCVADSPRISGSVVSFSSKQDVSAKNRSDQFMTGMNRRAWQAQINGHLVSVSPVSVLEPSGQPASSPELLVRRGDANATSGPSARVETLVETYMSSSGLLYRVYSLEAGTAFYCADIALPLSEPSVAMGGKLYYNEGSELYEQVFEPRATSLE